MNITVHNAGSQFSPFRSTKARKLAVGIQVGGLTEAESELMEERMSQMREQRGGSGGRGGGSCSDAVPESRN